MMILRSALVLWLVLFSSSGHASARFDSSYRSYASSSSSMYEKSLRRCHGRFMSNKQLHRVRHSRSQHDAAIGAGLHVTLTTLTSAHTPPPPVKFDDQSIQSTQRDRPLSYQDLSPFGRLVAGTVEIGVVTVLEYISGMFGGYMLGSLTEVPSLLFRPVDVGSGASRGWNQLSGRFMRLHSKSLRWGTSWAEISATCGGMNVAIRAMRGGVDDEWNTVLGSMAAGAFFRRKEGLRAMVSGAAVYGALVYFLSGGFGRQQRLHFKEQPIEF